MAVPYFRLQVSVAERKAVDGVLQSGWLTTGQQCFAFENEFASAISPDVKAISVSSNTAGMHLVLEALGIGPGDEVIVPSLTFTATAEVVRYLGADVVFVDVDAQTLCITAEVVAHAITQRTKAIMVVHFGGLAADLEALSKLAQHHGLKLVEDAAHSFPCSYKTSPIGAAYSDAAVFQLLCQQDNHYWRRRNDCYTFERTG